jgi:diguanylate cyclase (GGDEF)-like protein
MDDLTSISNRRGFMMLAQNSLNMCSRNQQPASLIFFDLNDFKQVNDQYGHAEGDTALKAFADQMKQVFRNSDVIARIGGDEFVVLLSGATIEYAMEITSRFQQTLTEYNQQVNRGYAISFSEGIIEIAHDQTKSLETMIDRADSAMYDTKLNLKFA